MPIHNHPDPSETLRQQSLSSQSTQQHAQSHASHSAQSSPQSSEALRLQEAKRTEQTRHAAPAAETQKAHAQDEGSKLDKHNKTEDWKNFSGSHVPPTAPPLQSHSAGTATPVEGSKSITAAQLRRDLEHGVKA